MQIFQKVQKEIREEEERKRRLSHKPNKFILKELLPGETATNYVQDAREPEAEVRGARAGASPPSKNSRKTLKSLFLNRLLLLRVFPRCYLFTIEIIIYVYIIYIIECIFTRFFFRGWRYWCQGSFIEESAGKSVMITKYACRLTFIFPASSSILPFANVAMFFGVYEEVERYDLK